MGHRFHRGHHRECSPNTKQPPPPPGGHPLHIMGSHQRAWAGVLNLVVAHRSAGSVGTLQLLRSSATAATAPHTAVSAAASAAAATAAAGGAAASAVGKRHHHSLLRDYQMLSKWRLSLLVALTGSAGFVMGSEGWVMGCVRACAFWVRMAAPTPQVSAPACCNVGNTRASVLLLLSCACSCQQLCAAAGSAEPVAAHALRSSISVNSLFS